VVSPSPNAIAGWMTNPNPSLPHPGVAQGPPGLVQPPNTGEIKLQFRKNDVSHSYSFD
jgi:hypothetical protein